MGIHLCPPPVAINGSIAGATAGSVLYAGTAGILAQDNANFFYDSTNKRLGIGTAAPGVTLDVVKNGALAMRTICTGEGLRIQAYAANNATFLAWYNSTPTRRGYFGFGSASSSNFTLMNEENGTMILGTNNTTILTLHTTGGFSTNGTNNWTLAGYTGGAPAATGYVSITIGGTAYKLLAST